MNNDFLLFFSIILQEVTISELKSLYSPRNNDFTVQEYFEFSEHDITQTAAQHSTDNRIILIILSSYHRIVTSDDRNELTRRLFTRQL